MSQTIAAWFILVLFSSLPLFAGDQEREDSLSKDNSQYRMIITSPWSCEAFCLDSSKKRRCIYSVGLTRIQAFESLKRQCETVPDNIVVLTDDSNRTAYPSAVCQRNPDYNESDSKKVVGRKNK